MLTGGPLLHSEELTRLALHRRPAPGPDRAQVYLARSGRLYAPTGGLSATELWRRAPRRVYDVDLAPHPLTLTIELSPGAQAEPGSGGAEHHGRLPGDSGPVAVELSWVWRTVSPVAVVTHQLVDVPAVARPQLVALVEAAVADQPWRDAAELAALLDGRAFPPVNLAEGICLFQVRARVLPA
jgi:hypothetical protein